MALALINKQQVNVATLPSFLNEFKEDKCRAAQWLQKVQAVAWNEEQIITHFRNALKRKY
jgi:hypothetical protein